jgi:hypothetical protein
MQNFEYVNGKGCLKIMYLRNNLKIVKKKKGKETNMFKCLQIVPHTGPDRDMWTSRAG